MTSAATRSLLLFALNWLDAQLTIIWVRTGWATEGNRLMAHLLDAGDLPFLAVKLTVGAAAAYIFYRFSRLPLARGGARFALGLYLCLMLIHAATCLTGSGLVGPDSPVAHLTRLPETLLAFIS